MELVTWAVAIAVAVPLLVTGSAKLVGAATFRRALVDTYGVAARWSGPLAVGVPALELIAAALVIVPSTRPAGFAVSCLSFAAFGVVASMALVTGRSGDCGCLGELRAEPLSGRTARRAFALAGFAGVGLVVAMPVADVHPNAQDAWSVLVAVALLILGVLAYGLARLVGATRWRDDGPIRD